MPRIESTAARLAKLGFADGAAAARLAHQAGAEFDELLEDLVDVADPDLALATLTRLAERAPDLAAALRADERLRTRLLAVLGVSAALGDHLVRHPGQVALLGVPRLHDARAELLRAVGAEPGDDEPRATVADALVALRVAYRGRLLHLAARDLTGQATLPEVTAELSDLAGAALEAALAIARAEVDAGDVRLAVIGMGKAGARELNYISDVDVIFVAEPRDGADETKALRAATRLAQAMMRACTVATPEGSLWEVDAGLRPEGRSGPLVRTLASHLAYYRRWAKTWEFQALLKARPMAGDLELGGAYVEAVNDLVWTAATRDNFVEDVQAMRRRVEAHVRAEGERQIKLGPGGLRDIEFAVQLLQLVHGRLDPLLRRKATLSALAALSRGGYVGRDDSRGLAEAYTFLRQVEHLLQLHRLRRTHVLPADPADLRRLGRALGMQADPVGEFTERWRRHAREARRLHEKLFYRPLLQAVARLPETETRLSTTAAAARLRALGYVDPEGALRHLAALTSGVSRRAAIQRTLLPVMLGWFADTPDPDAGLLGFRQVSDKLGATPWYLRLLRDETAVAARMARVLGTSRYATTLLMHAPDAVALLGSEDELAVRRSDALPAEASAAVSRHAGAPETAVAAVRALRRRELFRTAVADLFGLIDIEQVGVALSTLNDVTIQAALDAAISSHGPGGVPTRFAVIAMGRLGGMESSYASDADVMFVHSPEPGAPEREATDAAHAIANELRRLLSLPAPDPPLLIDPDLRPEGRQGPLVRTLASYEAYYARWSSSWESQALLRARFSAGDAELGAAFVSLADRLRYPAGGLPEESVREIRRLKARMEAERLPRGADPALHTKLGPGGLSDVEWVAQLLQLRHAGTVPSLRTTRTLPALRAAVAEGLLDAADEAVLAQAWRFASRVRDAVMLVKGRPGDSVPGDARERARIAQTLGYPPDGSEDFLDDYRRVTRRARRVVDRVFYGS
ncbi:bifunctional [glutamine synthetase] adenylyltransferase/[glutamine synthetase]-adenylyl-L-tyrosine phosphorylase [Nonomuraea cavernae]|uniref:Bifunctional glutamine synthetase adenylyltransferase/adenylyl-removing enzyme n=1 Tax=Nonomuraea cavernae TaxID=2045107 RepID=A0A918DMJ9_9ACTN|nr:bifunctional [glutamine synthetase] adenylyltransferase/[glutamine synthetase]-adenylyl-L-tyrosine phosphorylase [Nonomuraea cavernae]MCA2188447.1 bifunctional [glutamine synthetase] adenylyltransferase/[glutamine synthetase]-adenylyl-L-tyrosine phosphorylase [Nonomuraea cavernae]GGO73295.1 glutamate-ammonia-ligase adenylyltransferase [Nonomuraea cavernae]